MPILFAWPLAFIIVLVNCIQSDYCAPIWFTSHPIHDPVVKAFSVNQSVGDDMFNRIRKGRFIEVNQTTLLENRSDEDDDHDDTDVDHDHDDNNTSDNDPLIREKKSSPLSVRARRAESAH